MVCVQFSIRQYFNDKICFAFYKNHVTFITDLSGGQIAGIVIGVLLGLIVMVGFVLFMMDKMGIVNVKDKASNTFSGAVGLSNPVHYENQTNEDSAA